MSQFNVPKVGTIGAAREIAQQQWALPKINEEKHFFGDIYNHLLKLTGMQVSPKSYHLAAERAVSDEHQIIFVAGAKPNLR